MKLVTKIQRNSSFEALRIIAMLMIVVCHNRFFGDGGGMIVYSGNNVSQFFYFLICIGGIVADNIFALVSGYYLIEDNNISVLRIIRLWGQVLFYSIIIYLFVSILGMGDRFSIKYLVINSLPITFNRFWFASTYLVLYVIHPFINIIIKNICQHSYLILLAVLYFLWCIIPSFTFQHFQSNSLLWFITLYMTSGYIRLYGIKININFRKCLLAALFFYVLSAAYFTVFGSLIFRFNSNPVFFVQHIAIFAHSLAIFIAFTYLKPTYNKFINIIASATFGVYLIHTHPCIWISIWQCFSNVPNIVAIVVVYIGSTIIELLRQHMIEKPFLKLFDKFTLRPIEIA